MPNIRRQTFFAGGTYAGPPEARVMQGQICVDMLTPEPAAHRYPLVLIHGMAQTAVNWLTTPDGRQGWAEWFAEQGWSTVILDQAGRGRSAWQPGLDTTPKPVPVGVIEKYFTAPAESGLWPQARLHTQWPGGANKGHAGDPVFDQFYASQVASLPSRESETLMRAAGAALLDRIGPSVLVTHSQAGLYGWLIADARPALVKAIVALEPSGPPCKEAIFLNGNERSWGLTSTPLTYDPPPSAEQPLAFEQQSEPDAPDLVPCWAQKGAPRRLKNLAGIPVLVVTGEASYHAAYDHCTARYLEAAGVKTEFVRLADKGIRGNGHMLMLEKNTLEIAAFLDAWLSATVG
jgi:pimeloyl-ACP methyl ester carboxylesterase